MRKCVFSIFEKGVKKVEFLTFLRSEKCLKQARMGTVFGVFFGTEILKRVFWEGGPGRPKKGWGLWDWNRG